MMHKQKKFIIPVILLAAFMLPLHAQTPLFTGTQNRIVVFARFNGDPELDVPRTDFESMFNGESNSLQSYFKAVSNDQLTVRSRMYPQNTGTNDSYELKYCYYCYDSSWKGSYQNCKGNDITSLFDINMGFILKELATKLEDSGDLPEDSLLDKDNDGYVDNFVIVFRGAARGANKGIYSPQTGTVSSTFTDTNGNIQIKGKTIKNYTITFERNSLDTHCRFLLRSMGFPVQYRNSTTIPRTVGAWDPMDGPLLSYPLVYNRMKYTGNTWITEIPPITASGVYTLSSADNQTNNAYKILSADQQQFWILEYRDKSVTWDTHLPESGLIIYRVNTNYTGAVTANPEVYLYREDGTASIAGNITKAPFSDANGRTAFSATSNPGSFLSNGTISNDIDISEIAFDGNKMSFRVNKIFTDIKSVTSGQQNIFVEPHSRIIHLQGEQIEQLSVFDSSGRILHHFPVTNMAPVALPGMPAGMYLVKIKGTFGEKTFKIILQ